MVPEKDMWFAIQVVPRHERKVETILQDREYGPFLPVCQTRRNWSDRVKVIEQPLFPGYIFCRSRASRLGNIRHMAGVVRIISFGGKPCPVSDSEIEALQRVVDSGRNICSSMYFATGERVRVITGPLVGIMGVITQIKKHSRLVISVEVILKSISVEIDVAEVEPLHQPAFS